jgi:hypothetical protein
MRIVDVVVKRGRDRRAKTNDIRADELANQHAIHRVFQKEGWVRLRLSLQVWSTQVNMSRPSRYIELRGDTALVSCRTKEAVRHVRQELNRLLAGMDRATLGGHAAQSGEEKLDEGRR